MTQVVVCGSCGPTEVGLWSVDVHRNPRTGFALYAFLCPGCGGYEVGGCRETAERLARLGARQYELRCPDDPPLALDELIDLRAWLDTDPVWDGGG